MVLSMKNPQSLELLTFTIIWWKKVIKYISLEVEQNKLNEIIENRSVSKFVPSLVLLKSEVNKE